MYVNGILSEYTRRHNHEFEEGKQKSLNASEEELEKLELTELKNVKYFLD